ncbi:hypothetical protein R0052_03330 [Lactobacillus helveticus R0052]|nr:hypothetical protein R0052_03330 [Lactobacillus helveticus R0052]
METVLQTMFFISIHALTRSATGGKTLTGGLDSISIHALTRSATSKYTNWQDIRKISIHALTRSATSVNLLPNV